MHIPCCCTCTVTIADQSGIEEKHISISCSLPALKGVGKEQLIMTATYSAAFITAVKHFGFHVRYVESRGNFTSEPHSRPRNEERIMFCYLQL